MLYPFLLIAALTLAQPAGSARRPDEGGDAFEARVRPILVEHCYECHGPQKQESGLRFDRRKIALAGGDNGPVVVPGQPDQSRLIEAVRYLNEDLQMPPDGPLSADKIDTLVRWIEAGAVWPDADGTEADADLWRSHWAFQPVHEPPPTDVSQPAWCRTAVDRFVLSRLDGLGLAPSRPADRRTLIRRLSYDLLGLPPTPEETAAFENDPSPDAVDRLVDRLLASPRFGERWARHWLDLARYADNKGYKFFGSDEFHAYTYRDWVIQSLNGDLPYDQFILYQLAADHLVQPDDTRPLAAMGFLTVGRRFLEDRQDIIDDRIDVTCRGLLGLTVTCARCHDHKYDPIPSADYYSLYGVFATAEEQTRTLAAAARQSPDELEYERQLAAREGALTDYLETSRAELVAGFRTRAAEYLLAGRHAQSMPPMDKFMFVEEPGQLSELAISRFRALLDRTERRHDPILAPWHAFAAIPPESFASHAAPLAAAIAENADRQMPIHPLVARLFHGPPPANLDEVASRYGGLFLQIEQAFQVLSLIRAARGEPVSDASGFDDPEWEALRRMLYGPWSPTDVPLFEVEFLVGRPGQARINELRAKVAEFTSASPIKPARAMILQESLHAAADNPRIFIRGKSSNLGPEVPRRFLGALAADRRPFDAQRARLDLARAIVDPQNPLTSRVIANRVWRQLTGAGLVATASDFGLRSDPPTHPELLDYLAARLTSEGWSIKSLVRLIVTSSAYQQECSHRPEAAAIDADNRYLWRMNRRRLDWESTRDSLLAVSGRLDGRMGGRPVSGLPAGSRRTVYGFIDRQNLPGLFQTFDFASPDAHHPGRMTTTVPQQALFFLNDAFVIDQARALARWATQDPEAAPEAAIERLYQRLFCRPPDADEVSAGLAYLDGVRGNSPEPTPWRYGYGRFDAEKRSVDEFHELPHWTGRRWQGGEAFPDPAIGWVYLDARGGHPGESPGYSVIRRWVAPRAVRIMVSGWIGHAEESGDGIVARVVSSRHGELCQHTVHKGKAAADVGPIDLQAGDCLDFLAERRENVTNDQHEWSVRITQVEEGPTTGFDAPPTWDSQSQFAGPPLSAWERYAQALLATNEMAFID
jgi:hypothetical protein